MNCESVLYKIFLNGECRKFRASARSFNSLQQTIATHLSLKNFSIAYIDSDGDNITIGSDNELQMFLSGTSFPYRLIVTAVSVVENAPEVQNNTTSEEGKMEVETQTESKAESAVVVRKNPLKLELNQELQTLRKEFQGLKAQRIGNDANFDIQRFNETKQRIQNLVKQLKSLENINNHNRCDNNNNNENSNSPQDEKKLRPCKAKIVEKKAGELEVINEQRKTAVNLQKQKIREQMEKKRALQLQIQNIRSKSNEEIALLKQQIQNIKSKADLEVEEIKLQIQALNDHHHE